MNVTVTTFGCAEYLCHHGYTGGKVEFLPIPIRHPKMAEIEEAVCSWFGVTSREMRSARRFRDIARPRQIAMYLCRELTPRSLPEIGRWFGGRDHSTVVHAVHQIERLVQTDEEVRADVQRLRWELRE